MHGFDIYNPTLFSSRLNNVVFAVLQHAAAEPWEAGNELEASPCNYPSNASCTQQMLGFGAGSGAAGHLNSDQPEQDSTRSAPKIVLN